MLHDGRVQAECGEEAEDKCLALAHAEATSRSVEHEGSEESVAAVVEHFAERTFGASAASVFAVDGVESLVREESDGGEEPDPSRSEEDLTFSNVGVGFKVQDQQGIGHTAQESEHGQHVGSPPVRNEGDDEIPVFLNTAVLLHDTVVVSVVLVVGKILEGRRGNNFIDKRVERRKGFITSQGKRLNDVLGNLLLFFGR